MKYYTPTKAEVILPRLTKGQTEMVVWALDAMSEVWADREGWLPDNDWILGPEDPLPNIPCFTHGRHEGKLVLTDIPLDVVADLLYRLRVQAQEMAETEGTVKVINEARAAWNASEKILVAYIRPDCRIWLLNNYRSVKVTI